MQLHFQYWRLIIYTYYHLDEHALSLLSLLYLALNAWKGDDVKVCCSNCDYFEIWSKGDDAIFFYCKNEYCRKWTWLVCKLSFNYPRDICNLTKKESRYINSGKGHQEHIKWIESKNYIEEISKIWDQQNMRFCPNWGTGGRKDDKWTHIIWSNWKSMFCYVWEALINKDKKFEHNSIDFYININ